MRVAIDTNGSYASGAGVARYIHGLLRGLAAQPDIDPVELAWPVETGSRPQPLRALGTAYRELVWTRTRAANRVREARAELLHETYPLYTSSPAGVPRVTTLHDLAVLRFPHRFRRWHRHADTRRLRHLCRTDHVICDSRFTADEAMALLSLPAHKIEVVHLGCDFGLPQQAPVPPEGRGLPDTFFLFVGSLEPGKNLALLADVYRLAEGNGQALPPLLIAGARWQGVQGEGPPPAGWRYLGRPSDEVLVWLYSHALALVFPSKYEGFGLPLLEAMTMGCPCLCSPVASLPEVAGDAACFVELEPKAYLTAMRRLCNDAAWRADLATRGRTQAARFSWEKCAAETAAVYRHALRG